MLTKSFSRESWSWSSFFCSSGADWKEDHDHMRRTCFERKSWSWSSSSFSSRGGGEAENTVNRGKTPKGQMVPISRVYGGGGVDLFGRKRSSCDVSTNMFIDLSLASYLPQCALDASRVLVECSIFGAAAFRLIQRLPALEGCEESRLT